MKLDSSNGFITIGSLSITPSMSPRDIESFGVSYTKTPEGNPSIFIYHFNDLENGEIILDVCFNLSKIVYLEITLGTKYVFPKFNVTEPERMLYKKKLDEIGGEKKYTWFDVVLDNDERGGGLAIIVMYK